MATPVVNIFADDKKRLFLDPQKSHHLIGPLFQAQSDPTTFYLDRNLTIKVNVCALETKLKEKKTGGDRTLLSTPLPLNMSFTKDQTLFLIDLMRQQLLAHGEGLPQTLKELNARLRAGNNKKILMWRAMATKLTNQFNETFCPSKVARKWLTLEDAYKKVVDNSRATAQGTTKFQFFREVGQLLCADRDQHFPIVGTVDGVEVQKSELFMLDCDRVSRDSTPTGPEPQIIPSRLVQRKRRRTQDDDKCSRTQDDDKRRRTQGDDKRSRTQSDDKRRRTQDDKCSRTQGDDKCSRTQGDDKCSRTQGDDKRRRTQDDETLMAFLRDSEAAHQRRHEEALAQLKSCQQRFESLMQKLIDKL